DLAGRPGHAEHLDLLGPHRGHLGHRVSLGRHQLAGQIGGYVRGAGGVAGSEVRRVGGVRVERFDGHPACVAPAPGAAHRISAPDRTGRNNRISVSGPRRAALAGSMRIVSAREVPSRFAVAFSLAGEQRQLVLPVAQEVEAILGRSTVFYDDWYEYWIAGSDADLLLQELYGKGTELVVVCVSGAYGAKPWTRTEHRAVRARLMRTVATTDTADRHRVLPVRVGDGEVEGVLLTEIVPDLRGRPAVEAAELIVARLNLVRAYAGAVEPIVGRWPGQVPELHWPMADHGDARAAFARLLSDASPKRALLVRGASETGKSHMSKQMIRNASALPGIRCGRFDFKGTANMGIEVEAFSRLLGIEPPPGTTLNERLA